MNESDPTYDPAADEGNERRGFRAADFERHALAAALEMDPATDVDAMGVGFNIIRAANRLQQDLEVSVYRPAGVTGASFRVLFALRSMGPMAPRDLAHLSSVSSASISSVLNTLERSGFVERVRDQQDGRMVIVHLTATGRAVLARVFGDHNRKESAWTTTLTAAETAILAELLRKLLSFRLARAEIS